MVQTKGTLLTKQGPKLPVDQTSKKPQITYVTI